MTDARLRAIEYVMDQRDLWLRDPESESITTFMVYASDSAMDVAEVERAIQAAIDDRTRDLEALLVICRDNPREVDEIRIADLEQQIERMRCGPKSDTEAGSRYGPGELVKTLREVADFVAVDMKPARDRAKAIRAAADSLQRMSESYLEICPHEIELANLQTEKGPA